MDAFNSTNTNWVGTIVHGKQTVHAKYEGPVVLDSSSEEAQRLLSICKKCPHYREDNNRCLRTCCSKSINFYLKFTSCPVGNWKRN